MVGGKHDWNLTNRASPLSSKMEVPRGRVTGGTSAINGQVFLRPIPNDFERWVDIGNDDWSYEKALPYMIKIETDLDFGGDFHGKDGAILVHRHPLDSLTDDQLAFYQACSHLRFPENPDHNLPDATRVGPYSLNNPGASGLAPPWGILGKNEIVLCAGAIESPHLLMISGVGPSDQLEKHGYPSRSTRLQ